MPARAAAAGKRGPACARPGYAYMCAWEAAPPSGGRRRHRQVAAAGGMHRGGLLPICIQTRAPVWCVSRNVCGHDVSVSQPAPAGPLGALGVCGTSSASVGDGLRTPHPDQAACMHAMEGMYGAGAWMRQQAAATGQSRMEREVRPQLFGMECQERWAGAAGVHACACVWVCYDLEG